MSSSKKKQGTQEFFPRTKVSKDSSAIMFNKAPINKRQAHEETKTRVVQDSQRSRPAQPTFLHKLYQDDDEYDELKVHGLVDEDDQEVNEARNNKRKEKQISKRPTRTDTDKTTQKASRLGKLQLKKDALGLFCVCEVEKDYLIVNHTRNTKGYVELPKGNKNKYSKGDFIVASVTSEVGGAQTGKIYNFKDGMAGLNRKLQLSMELKSVNKLLTAQKVTKNMVLQAKIQSKEAKGYILDFGFRDHAKGFLKNVERDLKIGIVITVIVKTVIAASKVLKCEIYDSGQHASDCVQQPVATSNLEDDHQKLTTAHMKPGFLVSGKVSELFSNGVEVTYLGGLTGTCFIDHMPAHRPKIGDKTTARVISVDPLTKKVTLSMKEHLLSYNVALDAVQACKVGQTFTKVKVSKHLYGNSYQVDLGSGIHGFLHKIQVSDQDQNDESSQKRASEELMDIGQVLDEVRVKEWNYFDGVPVISAKEGAQGDKILNYHMVTPGMYLSATIQSVNASKGLIVLSVNDFIKGHLHIEHMADNPIKTMPPKLTEVGKTIQVRVLSVDQAKRYIEFTKKDSFMKDSAQVYNSYKEVKNGDKVICNVVAECEHGLVVKSFGNIKGLITFDELKAKYGDEKLKPGTVLKAYTLFKKADQGLALTLSKDKVKSKGETGQEGAHLTLSNHFLPQTAQEIKEICELSKKKSKAEVGSTHKFRILNNDEAKTYIVMKGVESKAISILPRCLVSSLGTHTQSLSVDDVVEGIVIEIL
jgi:ribosomal protein S1